jgi:hypothetical protein
MRRDLWAVVLVGGAASLGCHTIYEELPTRPGAVNPAPAPVVVVPVPVPSNAPTPVPPQQPSNPAPAPTQAPAPRPTPTPNPIQQNPGEEGDFPNNNSPVARLGARVYFLECGGEAVPNSSNATEVQLGCRIHYDCTPKDAKNAPTRAVGTPQWTFSPANLLNVGGRSAYNPVATTIGRGTVCAVAEVDRVRSDEVCITIR